MIRVLLAAALLFKLWMLVDATQRRLWQWYMIILFPFGAWAYFFMIKSRDPKVRRFIAGLGFSPTSSITELQHRARETPSVQNRTLYGQALHDADRYEEARVVFAEVLAERDSDEQALYGIALCEGHLDRWQEAAVHLAKLVKIDPSHDNNRVWIKLAKAQWVSGAREEALATLKLLVRRYPRIEHSVVYAGYLNENGMTQEATDVLRESLNDYRHAPPFVRKNGTRFARQAKRMLAALPID